MREECEDENQEDPGRERGGGELNVFSEGGAIKKMGRREKYKGKRQRRRREIRGVDLKKETEGGASGDLHTTKAQVSRITSHHSFIEHAV